MGGPPIALKARKHDEIRVLAESKLDTIADHVSAAIMDGQISDEEFRRIMAELRTYEQMKADIRAGQPIFGDGGGGGVLIDR